MDNKAHYVGLWWRFIAALLDGIIGGIFISLVNLAVNFIIGYLVTSGTIDLTGPDQQSVTIMLVIISGVITFATVLFYSLFFETVFQATPGKMIIGAKIVIAETGGKPSFIRILSRFIAYLLLPLLTLGLAVLWIAFDKKKQGFHDKITGTVVIRRPRRSKAKK